MADELLARQLPQSLEAEQAVIGSMLIDPACIAEVIELLRPEDFYAEEHQRIFETIYSMFNTALKIDPVTVLDRLKAQGYYDEAGGRAYLMQLMEVTPTSANVKEYASIVRDKSMLRAIANAGAEIQNLAFSGGGSAAEVAELAEQKIYSVRQGREIKGLSPLKSVIMDLYAQLDERSRSDSDIPGLSTGFRDLDVALTGLNKSDLILVAARPGMGKTAFALNIALNAAKSSGKDVVVFQLEMSKDQLASRFLASEALLDSHKLKTGSLNQDDWIKIARATSVLAKTHLYVDDNPAITVAEIKAKCRRLGENLGLIVIDYIQLMQSGGKRSENRVQEVAEISRSLKIMAKELNVPVVCLSQLSRAAEQRADKRPMLSDLRESGAIEQDADIVMFIYRDDYYDAESDDKNVAEIILAKNRHGATGTVELQWIGQYTTFSSRDRIHS
ncbi:replicative DNA helicase [Butyricicoccus pullicaecorum]|uniref:Replicative DNA helicase n=2 Tax=Butyricicoccus pullicaecorum TaxID=501571 RepID=R8VUL5_9FIRM|nr:replicative DNA helicase [Butyricicoccus pullicaecorum 1.2]OUP54407.1 replicative DNA helicase [Butyricicoccus pullicaecorum]OUP60205.1 replicative DNA helicase [Butyricicoccus pullicaecorum]SKA59502.1 replicative DNA helicase [Butyricicoccus pullicaecorum DSM 23266]